MNLLRLSLVALLGIVVAEEYKAGALEIMTEADEKVVLTYVLKSIFYSARYNPYSSFSDRSSLALKSGQAVGIERMSVNNIRVVNVIFGGIDQSADFIINENNVELNTSGIKLTYTFRFDWRLELGGVHTKFGDGYSKMDCRTLKVCYNPSNRRSNLTIECKAELINITGISEGYKSFREWLGKNFNTITKKELEIFITNKASVLGNNMHATVNSIMKRIDKKNVLEYRSEIKEVKKVNDTSVKLIYIRDLWLYLNGIKRLDATGLLKNNINSESSHNCISISAGIIPSTIKVYAELGKLDGEFDMTKRGYNGTVKDFYEVMPELRYTYDSEEKVNVSYKFVYENITYDMNDMEMVVPLNFSIMVKDEEIMFFQTSFVMNYKVNQVKAAKKEFVDLMSNVYPRIVKAVPTSSRIISFFIDFSYQFAQEHFEGKSFGLPKVVYVPLVEPKVYNSHSYEGKDFCLSFKY